MYTLHDKNEIRLMIRDMISEMYNKGKIVIFSRKQINMIIERIVYKLNADNLPDIENIKQRIKKEASKKTPPNF